MQANSENNDEKEAEIAANRFLKLLEQEALYERIRQRGEELENDKNTEEEEDKGEETSGLQYQGRLLPMLKWAAAAFLVLGLSTYLWQKSLSSAHEQPLASHIPEWDEMLEAVDRGTVRSGSLERADNFIENQEIDSALVILNTLPPTSELTYLEGVRAYKNEDYLSAIDYFQKTYEAHDFDYFESAYLNLIGSYLKIGKKEKARKLAEKVKDDADFTEAMRQQFLDMTD